MDISSCALPNIQMHSFVQIKLINYYLCLKKLSHSNICACCGNDTLILSIVESFYSDQQVPFFIVLKCVNVSF